MNEDIADFTIIARFLNQFPFDVLPRTDGKLSAELKQRIDNFAAGDLPSDAREELSCDVLEQPLAIEYLAGLALRLQV